MYLQNAYTVPAKGDFDAALAVQTAGDPSAWSATNARYQGFFADLTTRFGFEDSLLMDTNGNVVYTAYKGVDLGTNLLTRPVQDDPARRRLPAVTSGDVGRPDGRDRLRTLSALL